MSRISQETAEDAINYLESVEARIDYLLRKRTSSTWYPNICSTREGFEVETEDGCTHSFPVEALYDDDWLDDYEAKEAERQKQLLIEFEAEEAEKRKAMYNKLKEEFGDEE